jgi:WD40 repeat protein
MDDDHSPTDTEMVPEEVHRQLSLPSEMVNRGLELAIRLERQQGIEKYKKPILKFPGLLNRSCINFSSNGEFAAITSHGKQRDNPGLVIWNVVNRTLSIFPQAGFKKAAPAPFFVERIPTDEQMGVAKESSPISDIKISVMDARYKPIGHPESTPWDIYSVALSRCGDIALIGYGDGSIYRCNIIDGIISHFRMIAQEPHHERVGAIAFSPDDRVFAECSGFQVRIRDTGSGREIRRFPGHNPYYNQMAFSGDGKKLLTARGEGRSHGSYMTLLDLGGKQPPVVFGEGRVMSISAVSIFPDHQRILSLDDRGTITVWNAQSGDEISHWKHTESDVHDLISREQVAGNLVFEMRNPIIWGLSSVAVSSDGRRILSGGGDHCMRLWTATGRELWEYPHDSRVVKVAFLPDGHRALSGCWDGSVYLWGLP